MSSHSYCFCSRVLIVIFIIFCSFSSQLSAEVFVYPGPDTSLQSDLYKVTVLDDQNKEYDSFVYKSENAFRRYEEYPENDFMSDANHWTTFSFSGSLKVFISFLNDDHIKSCEIKPTRFGIKPEIINNEISFSINKPCKLSIDINETDGFVGNPLLIFADPPEENVPDLYDENVINVATSVNISSDPTFPNIIYFPPGYYNLVEKFGYDMHDGLMLHDGDVVYIAGGAYVVGTFVAIDQNNITIRGRGIISGLGQPWVRHKVRPFTWSAREHSIRIEGWRSEGHKIEGITLTDPTHFAVFSTGATHVKNIKCLSWYFSSVGVETGSHSLIEDCFFKVNDDALKIYRTDITIRDCIIWQMSNGAAFQISWNSSKNYRNKWVHDCDVIHCHQTSPANNRAIFNCVRINNDARIGNYFFENIYIDCNIYRLIGLQIQNGGHGAGALVNLAFLNIVVNGKVHQRNYLKGDDGGIHNVYFENIKINGKSIKNVAQMRLDMIGNVTNVNF